MQLSFLSDFDSMPLSQKHKEPQRLSRRPDFIFHSRGAVMVDMEEV
jgi:hypothetical protein